MRSESIRSTAQSQNRKLLENTSPRFNRASDIMKNKNYTLNSYSIVKLRSRSRSGEGQVRVRKVKETKDLDLRYTLFLVFTTTTTQTFFLAFKGSRQVRWT